jgi:hypothetical protein
VTDVDRREALFDAALAAAVAVAVVVATLAVDARIAPRFVLVGCLGTVLAELLAGRHERRVRRAWRRPAVKLGSLCLAGGVLVAGVVLAPSPALSAACGALASYLLLVGLVAGGVVAPPRAWT